MYLDYVLLGGAIIVMLAGVFTASHIIKVVAKLKK
jgi:hypothetical protein